MSHHYLKKIASYVCRNAGFFASPSSCRSHNNVPSSPSNLKLFPYHSHDGTCLRSSYGLVSHYYLQKTIQWTSYDTVYCNAGFFASSSS
mmetsp:Transcript_24670/g.36219  ORF Transcript_24670/g.36219 Transcript_24670/m.36219 type:complete len:89 (+) Transcript_24670:211-477(+)